MRTYGRGGMRFNDPTDALSMLKRRYDNGGQVNGDPMLNRPGGPEAAMGQESVMEYMSPELREVVDGYVRRSGRDQDEFLNQIESSIGTLALEDYLGPEFAEFTRSGGGQLSPELQRERIGRLIYGLSTSSDPRQKQMVDTLISNLRFRKSQQ